MKYKVFVILLIAILGLGLLSLTYEGPKFSCADAPKEAITEINHEKVRQWVQIDCTPVGHIINPKEGYTWSYYGRYSPISFYAQGTGKNGKLEKTGHDAYYRKVTIIEVGEEKGKTIVNALSPNGAVADEVPNIYGIRAEAYNGERHTFFMLEFKDHLIGAMRCHKPFECENEIQIMPFSIYEDNKG